MKKFECFVGVDWSGAKGAWQKGLKVALARPGMAAPALVPGRGPHGRWSRADFAIWLASLIECERALVGLDFAFGFPSVVGTPCPSVLNWDYVEKFCGPDENLYGGRFFQIFDAPHGCLVNSHRQQGAHYSAKRLRTTERAAAGLKWGTPQSVFNAVGPAQVGPSSISGMRLLLQLKRNHARRALIWPFEHDDGVRSAIVEIFPRYFALSRGLSSKLREPLKLNAALRAYRSQPIAIPPASEDEGDALLSAAALRFLSDDPSLFELHNAAAKNEGWIFGVPIEPEDSELDLTPEQTTEIERRLESSEPYASDAEVRATFRRLTR